MAFLNQKSRAEAVFDTICKAIDAENLKYSPEKEKMIVYLSARGEDLPINVLFKVDEEREVLTVYSLLNLEISDDKKVEFAVAVNAANYALVNGCFDYNITDGTLSYRMANPFMGCEVTEQIVKYMLYCTFSTVDEYNDRFLALAKGMIDIQKFIELANS